MIQNITRIANCNERTNLRSNRIQTLEETLCAPNSASSVGATSFGSLKSGIAAGQNTGRTQKRLKEPEKKRLSDQYLAGQDVAEALGVDPATITRMTQDGILTRDEKLGYALRTVFREYIEHLKSKASIAVAKRALLDNQIALSSIAVERARGEVMLKVEVDRAWADIILRIRDKFRRIGSKLAPRLPFAKSEVEMETLINSEVDEVLTELSRPPDYQQEGEPK